MFVKKPVVGGLSRLTESGRKGRLGTALDERDDKVKDAILNELYKFHDNIFNVKDVPMSVKKISDTVGLNEKLVKLVCALLECDNYVKKIKLPHTLFYKITVRGIKYIESAKH
ncbi:MAG: hypothetical protein HY884_09520 [Deltaproteobacteria bacterium]|nr:hypothetical protein [Deltaproteobacteria bacterium]